MKRKELPNSLSATNRLVSGGGNVIWAPLWSREYHVVLAGPGRVPAQLVGGVGSCEFGVERHLVLAGRERFDRRFHYVGEAKGVEDGDQRGLLGGSPHVGKRDGEAENEHARER